MSMDNANATDQQSVHAEEVNKNVTTIKVLGKDIIGNVEQLEMASDQMARLSTEMEEMVKGFSV